MVKRKFMTLPKLKDGEKHSIPHRGRQSFGFIHKCCDCGLEHDVDIKRTKKHFILRFWRIRKRNKKSSGS